MPPTITALGKAIPSPNFQVSDNLPLITFPNKQSSTGILEPAIIEPKIIKPVPRKEPKFPTIRNPTLNLASTIRQMTVLDTATENRPLMETKIYENKPKKDPPLPSQAWMNSRISVTPTQSVYSQQSSGYQSFDLNKDFTTSSNTLEVPLPSMNLFTGVTNGFKKNDQEAMKSRSASPDFDTRSDISEGSPTKETDQIPRSKYADQKIHREATLLKPTELKKSLEIAIKIKNVKKIFFLAKRKFENFSDRKKKKIISRFN